MCLIQSKQESVSTPRSLWQLHPPNCTTIWQPPGPLTTTYLKADKVWKAFYIFIKLQFRVLISPFFAFVLLIIVALFVISDCFVFFILSFDALRKKTQHQFFASYYYAGVFCSVVVDNNLEIHSQVCGPCVHFGLRCQLKQVAHIRYHSCSSNSRVTTHSPGQLSPLKWLLIKSVCVFMEGRLSFTLAFRLITEWEVSDTCQNTGWGGGHGAILQVPRDATTTGWTGLIKNCTRGGRILFFKTITSITGGQHAFVRKGVWGRQQHSEGSGHDF